MKRLRSSLELEFQGVAELERCLAETQGNDDDYDDDSSTTTTAKVTRKLPPPPSIKLNDEAWVLMQSQSGGHKCYSLGFAYTIDKPKQSEVETATKIYWRCEKYRYLKCTGRAVSAGLKPPLKITIGHNHPVEPERKEFRQYRLQMKTNVNNNNSNNNNNGADLIESQHDNVNTQNVNEYDLSEQQQQQQHNENNLDYFLQDEFFTGK